MDKAYVRMETKTLHMDEHDMKERTHSDGGANKDVRALMALTQSKEQASLKGHGGLSSAFSSYRRVGGRCQSKNVISVLKKEITTNGKNKMFDPPRVADADGTKRSVHVDRKMEIDFVPLPESITKHDKCISTTTQPPKSCDLDFAPTTPLENVEMHALQLSPTRETQNRPPCSSPSFSPICGASLLDNAVFPEDLAELFANAFSDQNDHVAASVEDSEVCKHTLCELEWHIADL